MNAQHVIARISDTVLQGDFYEASESLRRKQQLHGQHI